MLKFYTDVYGTILTRTPEKRKGPCQTGGLTLTFSLPYMELLNILMLLQKRWKYFVWNPFIKYLMRNTFKHVHVFTWYRSMRWIRGSAGICEEWLCRINGLGRLHTSICKRKLISRTHLEDAFVLHNIFPGMSARKYYHSRLIFCCLETASKAFITV